MGHRYCEPFVPLLTKTKIRAGQCLSSLSNITLVKFRLNFMSNRSDVSLSWRGSEGLNWRLKVFKNVVNSLSLLCNPTVLFGHPVFIRHRHRGRHPASFIVLLTFCIVTFHCRAREWRCSVWERRTPNDGQNSAGLKGLLTDFLLSRCIEHFLHLYLLAGLTRFNSAVLLLIRTSPVSIQSHF